LVLYDLIRLGKQAKLNPKFAKSNPLNIAS